MRLRELLDQAQDLMRALAKTPGHSDDALWNEWLRVRREIDALAGGCLG